MQDRNLVDSGRESTSPVSTTKRTLLKAGWVAPVIMCVSLPRSGFAKNISGSTASNGKGKGHGVNGNGDGNGNGVGIGEQNSNGHGHQGG
jgi:hypothetical protein